MPDRYEPKEFEQKWRDSWVQADLFKTREDQDRKKFYGLDFFPYPSGKGLSVGHCRNYVPTDVICRMKFMQGYNVLHPMGFDAFGLPAENEAIAKQVHPAPMIEQYSATYRRQLELIGTGYDWSRCFSSSDPSYYKWTQWIFKLLHQRGLAERRMAAVNWDPVEQTVLADEEVVGGRGWRSGALVEKRDIPQWFFKITEYAQRLLDDLDDLDWPEGIKQMQRNWIGRSEGVEFELKVELPEQDNTEEFQIGSPKHSLKVFTTRIDTLYGATFAVIAPEHPLVAKIRKAADTETVAQIDAYVNRAKELSDIDRQATTREKTGVFTHAHAINPGSGAKMPIYIADYVMMGYGTGAIMAVPAHDERDFEFAQKYGIEIIPVISPNTDGTPFTLPFTEKDGVLINSGEHTGKSVAEGIKDLTQQIEMEGIGTAKVNFKLRDWLISRQRYWGCPIPIIYNQEGDAFDVPDDQLPVYLPEVENYQPTKDGKSPLSQIPEFLNCTTPEGKLGTRETDTMGGFACSSWYFLRFCDPENFEEPFAKDKVDYWMPVDCYVGGAEHAVMHLLYARFWNKVLFDAGLVSTKEPFQRLVNQGMLLAQTPYRKPREDERLQVGEEGIQITFEEAKSLPKEDVFYLWNKMSKSKGNVVTPDEAVDRFGADALRVFLLFVAPIEQAVQWSDEGMQGAVRFLNRVFRFVDTYKGHYNPDWKLNVDTREPTEISKRLRRSTHVTIEKATSDIEKLSLNTYISAMMTCLNEYTDAAAELTDLPADIERDALSEAIESFILLLAPAAPHSADELWEMIGNSGFTYERQWPAYQSHLAASDSITIAIQVNGKLRDTIEVPASIDQDDLQTRAMSSEKVASYTEGKEIRKVIVVPKKLVNIVVG